MPGMGGSPPAPSSTATGTPAAPPRPHPPPVDGLAEILARLGGGATGAMGGGAPTPTPAPAPAVDYGVVYGGQLVQLEEMGFIDREQNIRALRRSQGNVPIAIERLLNGDL
jgi:hypothetical protein